MSRLLAPAKLTVTLAVTGVRPDGYHELRAEMLSLGLCDELTFDETGNGLTVEAEPGTRADGLDDGSSNLVQQALVATGRVAGVHLRKCIPLGGGLGGGSSDAAAVLRWAGCDDLDVAASLGADVPFCLIGGRALVEGIGEKVTTLPFEARSFVLCLPPFGVETAAVYAAWDEAPTDETPNALTGAALRVEPRLAVWREALGQISGQEPVLAGSGSTWFIEGGPPELGTSEVPWLISAGERGRLVRTETVPPGWGGG